MRQGDVVRENNLIINRRVKWRDPSKNTAGRRRPDGSGCSFEILPLPTSHACHRIGGISAVHSRHDGVPVPHSHIWAVERETKGITRCCDEAVDNGILDVSVRPVVHGDATGGLARDGDLCRVTAEAGNVVADPFQGGALVSQAEILGLAWGTWEPEDVDTVVDCDYDDILSICKVLAIVERAVRVANGKT